jgi:hypothetical protein
LEINDHTFYSGSTERTSFNEAGYTSGFILGDLRNREWHYHQIPSRPMLKLAPIDGRGKTVEELMLELEQRSHIELAGAMATLEFRRLPRELYLQLDLPAIDKVFPQVFYLDKQFTLDGAARHEGIENLDVHAGFGSLREEFSRYLLARTNGVFPREALERWGWQYLAEAEAAEQEA